MTAVEPVTGGDVGAEAAARAAADTAESAARAAADAALAPINNAVLTGDPRAPVPGSSDNDTSIATTSWVKARISEAVISAGGRPSKVWDAIADGGANPATALGREVGGIIQAAFDAGNGPVYLPPGVNWDADIESQGPIVIPAGMTLAGPYGSYSKLRGLPLNADGVSPVASDLIHLAGDQAGIANLDGYAYPSLLHSTIQTAFTADGTATNFTVQISTGQASTFPATGMVAIGAASDDSTPTLRLTYTSKTSLGGGVYRLNGCNWLRGEAELFLYHTWTIPVGTDIAVFARGGAYRCVNDAQELNLANLYATNFWDAYAWGDDENWHTARVNIASGSKVVTWVSGDQFPAGNAIDRGMVGAVVSIVGAGGNPSPLALGQDSNEVTVATRDSATQVTLDTAAGATVTGAVMVWGGSAKSQGGHGGATFSRMDNYHALNFGRFGLVHFPDSDHPDLGNFKWGDGRLLSNYGHTAWLHRGSGIQEKGSVKSNGCNRGLDHGNGSPGTPGGSATANFNWGTYAAEAFNILGAAFGDTKHPVFPCVGTHAGTMVDKLKLQLAKSVDKYPLLIDAGQQTVMLDDIYCLQTQGTSLAFAFVRGGDAITIKTCKFKGNGSFKHVVMRSKDATNVNLVGPFMMTDTIFDATTGFFYKVTSAEDASSFDAPSGSFIEGDVFPNDRLASFYQKSSLAPAATSTMWRFTLRQQRGFILDLYGVLDYGTKTLTFQRRVQVLKDVAGGAPTVRVDTIGTDLGSAGVVAPTIGVTVATTAPTSTVAITLTNGDTSSLTGRVWGTYRGRAVGIEYAGAGAALGGMVIG